MHSSAVYIATAVLSILLQQCCLHCYSSTTNSLQFYMSHSSAVYIATAAPQTACSSTCLTAVTIQFLYNSIPLLVHSVQQKSSTLKFCTSCFGSDVTYSCHHNSSHFTSPYFCNRGVSLPPIHYNQSRHVYINRRHQYICLI
jgi:hypothetical protein